MGRVNHVNESWYRRQSDRVAQLSRVTHTSTVVLAYMNEASVGIKALMHQAAHT